MEYQVSRNRERASWIDRHYVERGSLADFTDKVERIEQIHSMYRLVSRNFNLKKNLLSVLLPYICHAQNFVKSDNYFSQLFVWKYKFLYRIDHLQLYNINSLTYMFINSLQVRICQKARAHVCLNFFLMNIYFDTSYFIIDIANYG